MAHTALVGEGETKVVIKTRVRKECDECGEPATRKFSFCYVNGRRDPRSSMYGRDDCTFCADSEAYSCDEHEKYVQRVCCPEEMSWASTFKIGGAYDHVFLSWSERNATAKELEVLAKASA